MVLTIRINHCDEFSKKAAELGITPKELADKVVNLYALSLHNMQKSDLKKGYQECGLLNIELAECLEKLE